MFSLSAYDFAANLHLYRWKDLNILLDVNSGAIHLLDDLAYETVEKIAYYQGDRSRALEDLSSKYPEDEVQQVMTELGALYEQGGLFSADETPRVDLSSMHVKAICLNVAHACNMRCYYCFASQGDFGMKPCLMDLETGKKAMEFLIANSGKIKNLEVDFFGGEPLLVADMLKDLVSYCRQREKETGKRFNFTLTTNSLLLDDEISDWVIKNDISLILSLDGRKEVNDQHRVLPNGQGTYDMIMPHIKGVVDKNPVSYYVRGTFTRKNLDFASDLQHMIDLGFDCISVEPAVGPDNGFSIMEENLPQVLTEYERLTDSLLDAYLAGKEINFFHYNLNLQKGPCLAKRSTGCGAGIEYLVITPEGDIYPCHQFVGEEEFYMGNIYADNLNIEIRKKFENNQLKDKECISCWARNFCGGGCHANSLHANGDMSKPHKVSCVMHKKRVEGAIYLELQKQLHG
ncbi:MAG: thioether cross-link-forming SCIFF peptide maturase [Syntrophomonadaceae bacterium]|nr:thioether cross-link-forming SCIFF peptide maturase [Syntrophomonadaceae bacterium]MDD3888658.1 thioether cross-link-forming SCIFF peptide maturase [Syntrophomonadaceae bacterium]MDD4548527.1 thioether cross-link-forming SCIFF peptide maturase [Syntrophomonadaceae bacterium]